MKKNRVIPLFLTAISAVASAQTKKPNVIFILADDLGYSDIQPYGQEKIKTPNLEEMSKNGMQFMQFYAGTSVSAPSRASLLTGFHTGHTHVRGNKEYKPEGQEPLGDFQTIGNLFQRAGYVTGCFGKWGLGFSGSGSETTDKGFDVFYGYNCQRQAHSYYPAWLYNNREKVMLNGKQYSQDLIHRQAIKFIRDNKDHPFFGYFAYTLPHAGLEQPDDSIVTMYRGKFPEPKPFKGEGDYAATKEPRTQFAAMVSRLDAYVGEIRKELERLGIDKNTLIIFTSDNGPHEEGGADPAFFANTQTLRGLKRSLYEGGIRVPMIAEWKGVIPAGTKSDLQASFWDMMPTFAQLTGQQKSWKFATDGISILPTLEKKGNQKKHAYLYWEFHEDGGRQAIIMGNWKLVKQKISSDHSTYELYNIKNDIFERTDLAHQFPQKVNEMKKKMETVRTPSAMFNFGMKKD